MTVDRCGALEAYRQQLDVLEHDPNATASYKQGLEREFAAMKAQLDGSEGAKHCDRPPSDWCCADRTDTGRELNFHHPKAGAPVTRPSVVPSSDSLSGNLPPALQRLLPYVDAAAKATGVAPDVLAAQIWQESRGNLVATSTNPGNGESDTGVMQINPGTYAQLQRQHPQLRGKSLSNPANNILAGAYLMADLTKQFGSVDLALRAYNSGSDSVDRSNANITTTGLGDPNYVTSVMRFVSDLQSGQSLPA